MASQDCAFNTKISLWDRRVLLKPSGNYFYSGATQLSNLACKNRHMGSIRFDDAVDQGLS
jgi:hypothetical protein